MHQVKMREFSVFKNEGALDINYIPPRLPHREEELALLHQMFRFAVERPGAMAQRVLVLGRIGTGKTVLTQKFGQEIEAIAESRGVNLKYVHVNCRECRGSLFLILQRAITRFHPNFPKRGYSAEELLHMLMEVLDEHNAHLILALDELEALIRREGSDPLYNLSRVQESRVGRPMRLSLICIIRNVKYLVRIDESTRSTLQRNIIHLKEYTKEQLVDILADRVKLAFRENAVPEEVVDFIAGLAASENGDARYAIELLWRSGKYADLDGSPQILPEHVRKAAATAYPSLDRDMLRDLPLHSKLLLLAIARSFKDNDASYITMGEAEEAYRIVCEEYGEKCRGHTQLWKYVNEMSDMGLLGKETSGEGRKGRTTLISLPKIPAEELEKELVRLLEVEGLGN